MSKKTAQKIRIGLLVTWLVLLVPLLALILYAKGAEGNAAMQALATTLVTAYLWGSIVVVAILEWIRRKK